MIDLILVIVWLTPVMLITWSIFGANDGAKSGATSGAKNHEICGLSKRVNFFHHSCLHVTKKTVHCLAVALTNLPAALVKLRNLHVT